MESIQETSHRQTEQPAVHSSTPSYNVPREITIQIFEELLSHTVDRSAAEIFHFNEDIRRPWLSAAVCFGLTCRKHWAIFRGLVPQRIPLLTSPTFRGSEASFSVPSSLLTSLVPTRVGAESPTQPPRGQACLMHLLKDWMGPNYRAPCRAFIPKYSRIDIIDREVEIPYLSRSIYGNENSVEELELPNRYRVYSSSVIDRYRGASAFHLVSRRNRHAAKVIYVAYDSDGNKAIPSPYGQGEDWYPAVTTAVSAELAKYFPECLPIEINRDSVKEFMRKGLEGGQDWIVRYLYSRGHPKSLRIFF